MVEVAYFILVLVLLACVYEILRLRRQMKATMEATMTALALIVRFSETGVVMVNEIEELRKIAGRSEPDKPTKGRIN